MKKIKTSEMAEETRREYKKKRWLLIASYIWLVLMAAAYMILFFMSAEGKINIPGYTESAKNLQLFVGFLLLIIPPIVAIVNIEPELRKLRRHNEANDYGNDYIGDAEMDVYESVFKENKEVKDHTRLDKLRIRRNVYAGISIALIALIIMSLNKSIHEIFLMPSIILFPISIILLVIAAIKTVFEKANQKG